MKQLGELEIYSLEEIIERRYGKIGTPKRDDFERQVAEDRAENQALRQNSQPQPSHAFASNPANTTATSFAGM